MQPFSPRLLPPRSGPGKRARGGYSGPREGGVGEMGVRPPTSRVQYFRRRGSGAAMGLFYGPELDPVRGAGPRGLQVWGWM